MDVIWIGAAFLLGLLFSRLQLPPLIGYLSAGLALASYGYQPGPLLEEIAHLGVLFLLFSVGLHIRLRDILRLEAFGSGLAHLILFPAAVWGALALIGPDSSTAVLVALMAGFSSTILTAKSLEARSELGALHGRIAIGILVLQDLAAVGILAWSSGETPSPMAAALLLLPLARPALIHVFRYLKEDELTLLFGLSLALGGAGLFHLAGLSGELGAIAAGMLLAGNEKADQMEQRLWSVKEFFLVGFFLLTGLQGLPDGDSWGPVALLLVLLPVKTTLFFFLFLLFRLRARTAFIAGISLTSYSEFMLIAGAVAARENLIPSELLVPLALAVVVSFVINAGLTRFEDTIWGWSEGILCRFERNVRHPDRKTVSLGAAEYLVVGMGSAGSAAYTYLRDRGFTVVGMDIDPERLESNLAIGRKVVYGDIQDVDLWQNLELGRVKAVMIAMGNKQSKRNAIRMIRENGFPGRIFALTMRPDERDALEEVGATAVSIPIRDAGRRLAELSVGHKEG